MVIHRMPGRIRTYIVNVVSLLNEKGKVNQEYNAKVDELRIFPLFKSVQDVLKLFPVRIVYNFGSVEKIGAIIKAFINGTPCKDEDRDHQQKSHMR